MACFTKRMHVLLIKSVALQHKIASLACICVLIARVWSSKQLGLVKLDLCKSSVNSQEAGGELCCDKRGTPTQKCLPHTPAVELGLVGFPISTAGDITGPIQENKDIGIQEGDRVQSCLHSRVRIDGIQTFEPQNRRNPSQKGDKTKSALSDPPVSQYLCWPYFATRSICNNMEAGCVTFHFGRSLAQPRNASLP